MPMSATTRWRAARGSPLVERLLDCARRPGTPRAHRWSPSSSAMWRSGRFTASIAKGSQDIHFDMSEQFALARELALGYPKHPPLAHGGGARLVHRLPDRRLGLLPAGDGQCRPRAVDRLAARRRVSRRREARRRARAAHAGAVLQLPRAQVQREHGADAAVGGDHAVVPALVRDAAPARRGARRARGGGSDVRQVLVGRCCCSGSGLPRSPIRAAPPISARPRHG